MLRLGFWLLALSLSMAAGQSDNTLASGAFVKKDVRIQGGYVIRQIANQRILELTADFKTKSGPDLKIIFSPLELAQVNGKNADGAGSITLSLLKSNQGRQTYKLPADLDLSLHRSLLIHCVKYSKLWGGAAL